MDPNWFDQWLRDQGYKPTCGLVLNICDNVILPYFQEKYRKEIILPSVVKKSKKKVYKFLKDNESKLNVQELKGRIQRYWITYPVKRQQRSKIAIHSSDTSTLKFLKEPDSSQRGETGHSCFYDSQDEPYYYDRDDPFWDMTEEYGWFHE